MRIFSLTKIDSGPEKQVEAEVWGTIKITNNTNNSTLDFILFVVFHTFYESVSECSGFLALYWPKAPVALTCEFLLIVATKNVLFKAFVTPGIHMVSV